MKKTLVVRHGVCCLSFVLPNRRLLSFGDLKFLILRGFSRQSFGKLVTRGARACQNRDRISTRSPMVLPRLQNKVSRPLFARS